VYSPKDCSDQIIPKQQIETRQNPDKGDHKQGNNRSDSIDIPFAFAAERKLGS